MTQTPEYSVIIPAYNEQEFLSKTLQALKKAIAEVALPGEIIVVDNCSDDDTAAIAKSFDAFVVSEEEHRIARVRNRGAEAAQGRYLIFIDADTIVDGKLLRQTLDELETGECCGGGAKLQFDSKLPFFLRLLTAVWNHSWLCRKDAAGCYFFVPKDIFQAVGGFNEKLYAGEELELSKELRCYGRKNGQRLTILSASVTTSARKIKVYGTIGMLKTFLLLGLFPRLRRYRGACSLWYNSRNRNS